MTDLLDLLHAKGKRLNVAAVVRERWDEIARARAEGFSLTDIRTALEEELGHRISASAFNQAVAGRQRETASSAKRSRRDRSVRHTACSGAC
jgi:DNA-binding transcriptional MerR regulator